uniref:Uncharacterized protein n=1 Tax=Arundo donax TaxID=35708 RepID=A0A0A9DLM2_ARUDO
MCWSAAAASRRTTWPRSPPSPTPMTRSAASPSRSREAATRATPSPPPHASVLPPGSYPR